MSRVRFRAIRRHISHSSKRVGRAIYTPPGEWPASSYVFSDLCNRAGWPTSSDVGER